MNKLSEFLKTQFDADLAGEFKPFASYSEGMDYIEYLTVNDITVSKRIDEMLTLILDKSQQHIVGFKIKGFRYVFNTCLKPVYTLQESDFIPLVSVLEAMIKQWGETIFSEEPRKQAYIQAFDLAKRDCPQVTDFPMAA